MTYIPIREATETFADLARRVEAGETITVTRDGRPVLELVPATKKGGLNWEAFEAYKKQIGVTQIVTYVAPDFDDPLPEDFLVTPLDFPPRT